MSTIKSKQVKLTIKTLKQLFEYKISTINDDIINKKKNENIQNQLLLLKNINKNITKKSYSIYEDIQYSTKLANISIIHYNIFNYSDYNRPIEFRNEFYDRVMFVLLEFKNVPNILIKNCQNSSCYYKRCSFYHSFIEVDQILKKYLANF